MSCSFPYCKQISKPGSSYCYDHGRLMGNKKDKPAVAPEPIAKTSDNMKDQLKMYKKLRKPFLTKYYKCQVQGCKNASVEVHHKKGREGKLLLDTKHWLAVCNSCHRKITDDPAWAMEQGYSELRLKTTSV